MAIGIFKREPQVTKFIAVEKLNFLYNFLTTLLVIIFFDRLGDPQGMLMGRFAILAGTFVLIYIYTKYPCRITLYMRLFVQMWLLSYWYPDTFEFNRIFPNLDHLFATLEQNIFGCQPALLFEQVCSGIVWREAFNLGYWLYYPMITFIATYYFFARPRDWERCTFIIMASFFIYYAVYLFLPVSGPQCYFPVIGDALAATGPYPSLGDYFNLHPEITIAQQGKGALFTELVGMAQSTGERPTAAFPSSHIGVSTVIMFLAYRAKKGIFYIMFPFYLLLCCATVYIKAHYLVDAVAGLATGLLMYPLTAWLYKKLTEKDFM